MTIRVRSLVVERERHPLGASEGLPRLARRERGATSSACRRCARAASSSAASRCAPARLARRTSSPPSGPATAASALFSRRAARRGRDLRSAAPSFDDEGRAAARALRRARRRERLLPERQRQGPRQQPRPLQARLLPRALRARSRRCARAGERVLVMGDFNTAHREIDLARPKREPEDERLPRPRSARSSTAGSRRLGRHVPALRARARATTRGGASASACARRTSAGASTTCSPRRGRDACVRAAQRSTPTCDGSDHCPSAWTSTRDLRTARWA